MAMTIDGAVDAIAATLGAVSGIGQVHKRRRRVTNEEGIQRVFVSNGVINAATVSWRSLGGSLTDGGSGSVIGVLSTLTFDVELVYGFEDATATEITFRTLVWNVLMAFNGAGKVYAAASHQERMTADEIGYMLLADTALVHYAKLALSIRGRVSP